MMKDVIIQHIKQNNLPIIICGAGIVGQKVYSICQENNIPIVAFCDGNIKTAQSTCCGLPVIHTPEIKEHYDKVLFIITVTAIKDVIEELYELLPGSIFYSSSYLLSDVDTTQTTNLLNYEKYAIKNLILCHCGYLAEEEGELFIRSLDLVITEKCTLKCKDCSNLMQYYETPIHHNTVTILDSIDTISQVSDTIAELRIIGGEAFLNKSWSTIIERALSKRNILETVIYTNGTIIPSKNYLSLLSHEKILIVITDYGHLSKKLPQLIKLFEFNNISYHILSSPEWLDCASVNNHNRTLSQNIQLYEKCCAKNMLTLLDGKLYRCPFSANTHNLKIVKETHFVDIFYTPDLKENIMDYISSNACLSSCNYCNSRPLHGFTVPSAIQITKTLWYQEKK